MQKSSYEMRISDGSSDVCSSDLVRRLGRPLPLPDRPRPQAGAHGPGPEDRGKQGARLHQPGLDRRPGRTGRGAGVTGDPRSAEHKSELPSLMRISYAVFCLKQKKRLTKIK